MDFDLAAATKAVERFNPVYKVGRISRVVGLLVEAEGTEASIGELCSIMSAGGRRPVPAEVVGFQSGRLLLMPYQVIAGIRPGDLVRPSGRPLMVRVGDGLVGRVLDGLGVPIDGGDDPWLPGRRRVQSAAPAPLARRRIEAPLITGIRAIDALLSCGEGQRVGIFSGSGVGKSVLLGMLARHAEADLIVLALIGERGREVREFLEEDLGPAGLSRSVVVAVTNDATALEKIKGAETAFTIAEHFRDQGRRVLLMMDSVTRYAMALREVGLATGEPPASKGYTPSVYAALPRLLERAGTSPRGSITGLFTVLVEGDDLTDPVADTVRSILDGHIVLSRDLAVAGHYPAIDVLGSVSRLHSQVTPLEWVERGRRLLAAMALYRENEDLIQIGAYQPGSSDEIDRAIALRPRWQNFLRQERDAASALTETRAALRTLVGD
ncbi:MAG: FliI/YscN family ATPase [Candidatus Krumholzibacteriota bacterium]|nr:FliI/YscN family ATPase [Candidatus Krumholzibacteriota bacterium]